MADLVVPQERDLWPSIQLQIAADKAQQRMLRDAQRNSRRRLFRTIMVPLLVLTMSLVALTEPVRAALTTIVAHGIRLVGGSTIAPAVENKNSTSTLTMLPMVDLATAQQQIFFTIPLPQPLPSDLALQGVTMLPPNWVSLAYSSTDRVERGLRLEIYKGPRNGNYIFPTANTTSITINGESATLTAGAWDSTLGWNSDADLVTIAWAHAELNYILQSSGRSVADSIHIAESVR